MNNNIVNNIPNNIPNNIIENTLIYHNNTNANYPEFEILAEKIRPNIVFDLNGILIYISHLLDHLEIMKYSTYKNFLLIYKDFDMNIFIIFYRTYLRELLLELNNYYDIYIYSSSSKTLTDFFVTCINNLVGINVFKKVYIKNGMVPKNLVQMNLDCKNTVIVDIHDVWKNYEKNLIMTNIFRGPHDVGYDTNMDLLVLKKCLLRIHKLFADNGYDDITKYIYESVCTVYK